MMPSMGLMTHVPIHASDAGTISASAATSTTMAPIHRAMKSQIVFICYVIAFPFIRAKVLKNKKNTNVFQIIIVTLPPKHFILWMQNEY